MNIIKKALQNELEQNKDTYRQMSISHVLFERLLEKKRRRDQKIKLWLQVSVLLLIVVFLCFVYVFSPFQVIPDTNVFLRILMLVAFLLFMDISHKLISLIPRRRH